MFYICFILLLIIFTMKGRLTPDKKVCKFFTASYLLEGGIRYSVTGYCQVGESVIQLVEKLYKGSVFS